MKIAQAAPAEKAPVRATWAGVITKRACPPFSEKGQAVFRYYSFTRLR
ncbi:hypothetical protein HMPREF1146_1390 [Prevotella sp. MSX73]|nr:hypothetical protein HMPREF1146_1390 [Prevotella sp. MSX73]